MAAKHAWLYRDRTPASAITGSATAVGADLSWLKDPQPRHRARLTGDTVNIIIDVGSGGLSMDCAALISSSLTSAGTARLRASLTDATVTGSLLYDSGVVANVTDQKWNGLVVGVVTTPIVARYWRWDLVDAGQPFIDVGLAPCGLLFRPTHNFAYGAAEGRLDSSPREMNPDTRAEFGFALPQARFRTFSLPALTKAETRGDVVEMDRIAGAAGDVLFIEEPDATWLERAQNSIWGSFRGPGDAAERRYTNIFGRSFRLTERL